MLTKYFGFRLYFCCLLVNFVGISIDCLKAYFLIPLTQCYLFLEMEKTCKDVELCQEYKAQFPELCSSSETWYKTNCPVSCERCSPEAITRNHPSRTRLMTTEKHVYSDTRETIPNTTYIRSAESRDYAGK